MVDVLKVEDDGVSIYEVKSSTSLKDIYLHDVSIQYYVLKRALKSRGLNIKSSNVVYINNEYVRGDELELDKLFVIDEVSSQVEELQSNIPKILEEFRVYLDDKKNEPNTDIGSHCKKPYECDAKDYCWKVQR